MTRQNNNPEQGAALLLLLLVIIAAASSVLVAALSESRLRLQRGETSQQALAQAKRALVDYALSYPDIRPGQPVQLPCPDLDAGGGLPDGVAHDVSCGGAGVSVLGRVPWKTLGIAAPKDAAGACLWYAVSGSYKSAAAATAAMINPDANGQFEILSAETGAAIAGLQPQDRPVAILLAPLAPLPGQSRPGTGVSGSGCSSSFVASDYLDNAAGIGVSNSLLGGVVDTLDTFAVSAGVRDDHNDRLLTITRSELATAVYDRHDFGSAMTALTRGIASCIAAYGLQNPAGSSDRRLPWPAPIQLADYRVDANYSDNASAVLSGRVPDTVDESNVQTGNAVDRILGSCNGAVAADWNPAYLSAWQHWKDHFFYAVAESHHPGASPPTNCGPCLTMNGGGAYAAVVLFAGARLNALGQVRNSPPIDTDTRHQVSNYLEGRNAGNHPYTGGAADFEQRATGADFNDVAFCIDSAMTVSTCQEATP